MTDVLTAVVLTGLVAGGFYWQRLMRSWHLGSSLLLWLSLLFLVLAVAFQLNSLYARTVDLDGWNVFWPTQWALVLACCYVLHVFAIRVPVTDADNARRANRKIVALTIVMAAAFLLTLGLFLTSPHDPDFLIGPNSRLAVPGRVPVAVGLAWIVIQLTLGSSCVYHAWRAFRWARSFPADNRTWLRAGLRVFASGFAVGSLYFAHSAIYQAAETVGIIPAWPQEDVTNPLITIAPVLMFIGLILPAVGAWRRERADGAAQLRGLAPLRERLGGYQPVAPVRLRSRIRTWLVRQWRPMLLVYEFVISLEDSYLRVRGELPDAISEAAAAAARSAGLSGERAEGVVLAVNTAAWTVSTKNGTDLGWTATEAPAVGAAAELAAASAAQRLRREKAQAQDQPAMTVPRRLTLVAGLERWLVAADVIELASKELDGLVRTR
ncbi:MAG TPA: hypothetical protein VHZ97_06985 [Pseudonocardiaceae bacterium]|jgi:hypothetical protein|nr:hypothetical protein [Pseudonocardiaceae bacterium]